MPTQVMRVDVDELARHVWLLPVEGDTNMRRDQPDMQEGGLGLDVDGHHPHIHAHTCLVVRDLAGCGRCFW
jgi:hypothetical protein